MSETCSPSPLFLRSEYINAILVNDNMRESAERELLDNIFKIGTHKPLVTTCRLCSVRMWCLELLQPCCIHKRQWSQHFCSWKSTLPWPPSSIPIKWNKYYHYLHHSYYYILWLRAKSIHPIHEFFFSLWPWLIALRVNTKPKLGQAGFIFYKFRNGKRRC